jgi:hypothetical protein
MITKADIERIKRPIPIALKGEFGKRAKYDGFKDATSVDIDKMDKIRQNGR